MMRAALIAIAALVAGPAAADPVASEVFSRAATPAPGPAAPIGSYAKGCAQGLVELPETGPNWQAMRLSRGRNWGHPDTIALIRDLADEAERLGWRGLYVGDISQPRGGPTPSDHASHQIGLDADIWMLPPGRLDLTRQEREEISSISVRTRDQKGVTEAWTPAHHALLRAAAADPRTDRLFVAAAVKIEMCRTATEADTPWLQKIRPIAGHNTHFHIRLRCPADAPDCRAQTPSVAELSKGGNGCDETLDWWVTDYLKPPDPNAPRRDPPPHPRTYRLSALPEACAAVLAAP